MQEATLPVGGTSCSGAWGVNYYDSAGSDSDSDSDSMIDWCTCGRRKGR